ncbi:hypothetical protein [Flavobacterium sp. NRK1]|uniref:beta strand repeat-containing protein n=1 Tax=Flavobacterium sp. NRK1 TaxID=2954929 RepID=UPI002092A6D8|nr:hypothetical protein [Flavobacterium sp. NRK1]MCO6149573.1 hypothetical protein [Flavobacterium sp. NRK1]
MMKYYLQLIFLFLSMHFINAQTTENFEAESVGSSILINGFTITSQIGLFDIYQLNGTGWNGISADNKYIDNSSNVSPPGGKQFTVSRTNGASFTLKSVWLYLATSNAMGLNVTGSCSITGKLAGATQYTATQTGFVANTSTNNGFTFINMASYGGNNNSNTTIDSFIITTTGDIDYIAMDALTWQAPTSVVNSSVSNLNNFTTCSGNASAAQSFTVSGSSLTANLIVTAPAGYEVSTSSGSGYGTTIALTPSSGTVSTTTIYARLAANATGDPSGNITVTSTSATTKNITVTSTINSPPSISIQPSDSTICTVGNNTLFSVTASNATGYQWQVNSGSGFTNISNVTPYSGTTTATLTLMAPASTLNNYQYRVIVSGACTPNATSNAATLKISSLSASISSQTNVSCNGGSNGSATVTATGGIGTLTYSWAPAGGSNATASGLSAGSYTVTVTDANGCTVTATANITQPTSAVSGTTVVTNLTCNGANTGAINLTPTGGTGPYTFNWGGGITTEDRTGLAAGSYSVTITDDNGCTGIVNATVTQPTAITASITSQTNVACNGGANGSATVTATGGTGTLTYSWAPSGGTAATATGLTNRFRGYRHTYLFMVTFRGYCRYSYRAYCRYIYRNYYRC